MSALFAGAGMTDMMTAGDNPAATPEMKAAMYKKAADMSLQHTLASGGTLSDWARKPVDDTKLPKSYYQRQTNEDVDSVDAKWQMWKKRNLFQFDNKPTPNELVRESFRDVRNPKSMF